ncbi:MAG: hypothetical protein IPK82_35005 [Polyangiaceae bacterium]|nr:hypothetical protein [Polyangiaceae bacterium]
MLRFLGAAYLLMRDGFMSALCTVKRSTHWTVVFFSTLGVALAACDGSGESTGTTSSSGSSTIGGSAGDSTQGGESSGATPSTGGLGTTGGMVETGGTGATGGTGSGGMETTGTGGMGTTGNGGGGSGGTGTGGTGAGGSGGAGGVWAPGGSAFQSACDLSCTPYPCVGNVCVHEPYLRLSAYKTNIETTLQTAMTSTAGACYQQTLSFTFLVKAAEGDCAAYQVGAIDGEPALPFDAGQITYQSPTASTIPLSALSGNCQVSAANMDIFSAGETVTFTVPGGATFPAFSSAEVAPASFTISAPPVQSGEPIPISFNPPTAITYVLVLIPGTPNAIICLPSQTTGVTVPGSLTTSMGSGSFGVIVTAWNLNASNSVLSDGTLVSTQVGFGHQIEATFSP